MFNFVRSRQLEGTFPGEPETGTWVTTSMRVQKGWGAPDEALWPYNDNNRAWPPIEPLGVDAAAKLGRVTGYQRVRTVEECCQALTAERPVVMALRIDLPAWKRATSGDIPDSSGTPSQAHSVCAVGFDRISRRLSFANSWGSSWGDQGYGTISFGEFTRNFAEAWTATPTRGDVRCDLEQGCAGFRRIGVGLAGSADVLIFDIVDELQDETIGWAQLVPHDGYLDVEELFVRPT